jgi:hypothetical protein
LFFSNFYYICLVHNKMTTRYGTGALAQDHGTGNNTAFGAYTLPDNVAGQSNVAVGTNALLNNTGDYNLAIGTAALLENTTGKSNVACGTNALQYNTTGNFNTAVGVQALFGASNGGSNNTAIGCLAGPAPGTDLSYTTAIGYRAIPSEDHQIMLGTSTESVYIPGNIEIMGSATLGGEVIATQNYVNSQINNGVGGVGSAGATGPQGNDGLDGATGQNGSAGPTGLAGATGQNGSVGISVGWTSTIPSGQPGSQIGNTGVYSSTDIGVYNNLLLGGSLTYPDGSVQLSATEFPIDSTKFGTTWLPTSPFVEGQLCSVSISASGQYQTAVANGGGIYTSLDYGNNWSSPNITAPTDQPWSSVSVSASGQYQTACVYDGGIHTSSNYGIDWSSPNSTQPPAQSWTSVSISASGQYQTAVIYNGGSWGGIYTSSDYGNNWSNSNTTAQQWASVSISASGQYQTACVYDGGIHTSSNYGIDWSSPNTTAPSDQQWKSVSISASGQYQTACVNGGGICTSSNYGIDWSSPNTTAPSTWQWQSVSISASGQYQTAVANGGGIYASSDYGNSWSSTTAPSTWPWQSVSISASGQYQTAGANMGGIYTSITPFASPILSGGLMGSTGLAGATGQNGLVGATGQNGLVGPTGLAGATGQNGLVGATGQNGLVGPTGLAGATGQNGLAGATGQNGSVGPTGLQGTAGIAGTFNSGTVSSSTWTINIGGTLYDIQVVLSDAVAPPTDLIYTAYTGISITLSWTAPVHWGNNMIGAATPYIVTYGPSGGSTTTVSPSTNNITINELDVYTPYIFYITATNSASPPITSAASTSLTVIPTPVPPPTALSYNPVYYSSSSIQLSCYAPGYPGTSYGNGSSITTYTFTGVPTGGGDNIVRTGTNSTITFSGFSAVEYTYRVTATNDQGYVSAPSVGLVVTPALPSAPTAFQFDGGDGPGNNITSSSSGGNTAVIFTWTTPTDVGIPITGYNLFYNGNSIFVQGAITNTSSLNLTSVTTTVAIYTTYGTLNSNSTDVGTAVNLTWWDPSGL